MHLAILVVGHGILLQSFGNGGIVDDYSLAFGGGVGDEVKDIEEFPGIASGITHDGLCLPHFHMTVLENNVVVDGVVEQGQELVPAQGFKYVDLTA